MNAFQGELKKAANEFAASLVDILSRFVAGSSSGQGPGVSAGSRRQKRSAEALGGLSSRFADYVASNPGLRIEQINKALGTTTRDLALPIRKLIAEKALRTEGQKRSTTYFLGKSTSRSGRKKLAEKLVVKESAAKSKKSATKSKSKSKSKRGSRAVAGALAGVKNASKNAPAMSVVSAAA